MTIGGVKIGDIVQCDTNGNRFHGLVIDPSTLPEVEIRNGELAVRPISGPFTGVRFVRARQVIGHWRKRKS